MGKRNEATSDSDVDLLVEFNRPVGYFGLFVLQDYLEDLLGCPVDPGTPDSLKPYMREHVMGEAIHVTQDWRDRFRDILDAIAEIQRFTQNIVYFPLKALTHILRILMEMEFRSRKAN